MAVFGNIIQVVSLQTQPDFPDIMGLETLNQCVNDNTFTLAQLEDTVLKLQGQLSILQIIVYSLLTILVLYILCTILLSRNKRKKQKNTDDKQDDRLSKLVHQLENKIAVANNTLEKKMKSMVDEVKEQTTSIIFHENEVKGGGVHLINDQLNIGKPDDSVVYKHEGKQQLSSPQKNIKYFTLQESGGQLSVKERNLKDDGSRSWFVMIIDGDVATYDINKQVVTDILADQAVLRICTNDFESNATAKSIKTLNKGTLRKEGQSWVVTNKITIELV